MARESLAADDRGQMMLLAAVVLIIGFVALGGMVSRVAQLAGQASKEQDRPLMREVDPLLGALNAAVDSGPAAKGLALYTGVSQGSAAYDNAVLALLRSLRQVEAGQGILMDWSLVCTPPTAPATQYTGYASVTLSDGFLQVTVRSIAFNRPSACTTFSG
ncbi:MAG TPA: hypothetical protein VM241_08910 [Candidatus Thermoplasmatota archaeon]|nr:hypothetical protein [Candidatus Thermoplasmatota archaeon]